MMVNCPICGKLTCIHWPEHWVYRRGSTYYCGENCMDISIIRDTKLLNEIGRKRRKVLINMSDTRRYIKPAEREEALELCNDRGKQAAVDYLTKIGIPNPEKCLKNLLSRFKDTTPAATMKVDGPIRIETDDAGKVKVVTTGIPVDPPFEYKTTGISTAVGDFQYFRKNGYLDWTDLNGETVSMNLEEWREFMNIFPFVLKTLEVEL